MRQIRQRVRFCWGNDGNELRARLDEAISWASGLEQGIRTDSEEYANGEQAIKDALMDLSVALLGRNIKFEGLVEQRLPEKLAVTPDDFWSQNPCEELMKAFGKGYEGNAR